VVDVVVGDVDVVVGDVDVVVGDVDVVEGDPLEPCPDEDAGAVVVVEEVEVVGAGSDWPFGGPPDTGPEGDPLPAASPAPPVGLAPGRSRAVPAAEVEVGPLAPLASRASEGLRSDDSPRTAGGDSECARLGRPKVGRPMVPSLGSRAKPAARRAR
jgi:hypothetical protein